MRLLVHAYNAYSPVHDQARRSWERALSDLAPVGLVWPTIGAGSVVDHKRAPDALTDLVRTILDEDGRA
jgi:hypothetical protein